MSTNIGLIPKCISDDTAVPKFKQGVITSLFFFKFNTCIASIIADEPELTINPYFLENFFAIFFSNSFTDLPI